MQEKKELWLTGLKGQSIIQKLLSDTYRLVEVNTYYQSVHYEQNKKRIEQCCNQRGCFGWFACQTK